MHNDLLLITQVSASSPYVLNMAINSNENQACTREYDALTHFCVLVLVDDITNSPSLLMRFFSCKKHQIRRLQSKYVYKQAIICS